MLYPWVAAVKCPSDVRCPSALETTPAGAGDAFSTATFLSRQPRGCVLYWSLQSFRHAFINQIPPPPPALPHSILRIFSSSDAFDTVNQEIFPFAAPVLSVPSSTVAGEKLTAVKRPLAHQAFAAGALRCR